MKLLIFYILFLFCLAGSAQNIYFPPNGSDDWDTINYQSLGYCEEEIDSLYEYLESTNSKAFILLKDGKIVLEKYFGTFNKDSAWYWASAGKTVTAFLTGIAQEQGHLLLSDSSSKFLGQGWTSCTPSDRSSTQYEHRTQ